MSDSHRKRSLKAGLPPGTLVHIGEECAVQARIRQFAYTAEEFDERELANVGEIRRRPEAGLLWLDIRGLRDPAQLEQLGQAFGLHPLLLEDVLNTEQRPKLEDYGEYLFIVLKRLQYNARQGRVTAEQVSLVLGAGVVLSFRESDDPLFDAILQRLRSTRGRLRKQGADFLVHALIDNVVDGYFEVLEQIGEEIEQLENSILDRPTPIAMRTLHRLKRELVSLRRSVWPLREVIGGLDRSDSTLLSPPLELYLRDVYDHTIHVIDTMESYRDMLSGMLDIYLSALSHRMNEVMKVLTIISTLFIPLTFLAGLYGMNFHYMPELAWHWGYYAVLGAMACVVLGMLVFFRRKRWI